MDLLASVRSYLTLVAVFFIRSLSFFKFSSFLFNLYHKCTSASKDPFSGLSEDLILEILYRLPAKSLGRCKVVCKSWLTLISDPEFAISHLDYWNSNYEPLALISQSHNILSRLEFCDLDDITEGVTLAKLDHPLLDGDISDSCYCFIVGSNAGLVCIYVKEMDKRFSQDSMHLWNPCTTEKMEISLPVEWGSIYVHIDSSWFGCVPSSNDYKIFLVVSEWRPYERSMYLYSLRSDAWRKIIMDDQDLSSITEVNSVFLDEAIHYLVHREWIVIFDLVAETFKKVPFLIEPDQVPEHDQILLGVIGEYGCLCAMFVHRYEEWMVELWTLKEYDKWDSWEIRYRIHLQEEIVMNCMQFLGFTYSGNLCIQQESGLVLIDPADDPPSHVVAQNPSFAKVYKVLDYVESLVSPVSIP